jgi:hypothetical protein
VSESPLGYLMEPPSESAMLQPVPDWGVLAGRIVELRIDERFIRTAEVEEVTGDGRIMWLRFHGNQTRQLITKTDGFDVRLVG